MADDNSDLTLDEVRLLVKMEIRECVRLKDDRCPSDGIDQDTAEFYSLLEDTILVIQYRLEHAKRDECTMFLRLLSYERRVVSDRYMALAQELMSGGPSLQKHIERRAKAIKDMTEAEAAVWDVDDAAVEIQRQVSEGMIAATDVKQALQSMSIQAEKLRLAIKSGDDVQIALEHKVLLNESVNFNKALTKAYMNAKIREMH